MDAVERGLSEEPASPSDRGSSCCRVVAKPEVS